MMNDDEGIKQTGRSLFAVRVKRLDAKTGRQRNRKATVRGTKADARRVRDAIRAELATANPTRTRIRLSEFAARWAEARAVRLRPSTRRRYKYSLEHIVPALGDRYLDSLAPPDVAAYVAKRSRVAEGYTVLNELRCLRAMAADALDAGHIDRNFCGKAKAPPVSHYTPDDPNSLNAEQFVAVIQHVGKRWLGLVWLMTTTSLRWGEASGLRWEDIDPETWLATIAHVNDRGREVEGVKTKGSFRTVPIRPLVADHLGKHRGTGIVFPTRKGKLHSGYPLIKVLREACKLAGVPRVTAHGLRRTFAELMNEQATREVIKSLSGHVTDTMVEHYTTVRRPAKERAVDALLGVLEVSRPREPEIVN